MATYFCVANSGWTAASFASSSGGAGGAGIPGANDDVIFDGLSPSFSLTSAATARSLDFNSGGGGGAYANTFTWGVGGSLSLSSTTVPANGVLLRMSATMTCAFPNTQFQINCNGSSTTTATITSAGKQIPSLVINTSNTDAPHIQLVDALNIATQNGGTTGIVQFGGVFDTNNQNVTMGGLWSGGSRAGQTLIGSSTVVCNSPNTSAPAGFSHIGTSQTVSFAAGASVTLNGIAGAPGSMSFGLTPQTLIGSANVALTISGPGASNVGGSAAGLTLASITRTGSANVSDTISFSSAVTITGTLTLTGNSTKNRLLVQSNVLGTTRTITAGAVALTNGDFQDIAAAGAAAPFTGTLLGDCLGNSGIAFPASTTQTWTPTGGGAWSTVASWTSRIPLPQDDVVVSVSSVMSVDMPRLGRNVTLAGGPMNLLLNPSVYGNLITSGAGSAGQIVVLQGRGAQTFDPGASNGLLVAQVQGPGGTYTLQRNTSLRQLTINAGTFDDGGHNMTLIFSPQIINSGITRGLTLSGTTTINGTGTLWNMTNLTGFTLNHTGTLVIPGTPASTNIINAAGLTYGSITISGGPGVLSFNGGATITGGLTAPPGVQLSFAAGTTVTAANVVGVGVNLGYFAKPGIFGGNTTVPNAAPLQITGSMTLDIKVGPTWTGTTTLLAKWATSQFGYKFALAGAGKLALWLSSNGTSATGTVYTSTVALPTTTPGFVQWVRASWTAGASGKVQFYYSSDGVTWTQLGTDVAATLTSTFNSTAQVEIGSDTNGALASLTAGAFYRARVYNTALGSSAGSNPVLDVDFSLKPFVANSFTESSTNAATVTLNGGDTLGDGRVAFQSTSTTKATFTSAAGVGGISLRGVAIQDIAATGAATWWVDPASLLTRTTGFTQAVPARTQAITQAQSVSESSVHPVAHFRTLSATQSQTGSYQTSIGRQLPVTQSQAVSNKPPARTVTAPQAQNLTKTALIPWSMSLTQDQALTRLPDTLTTTRTLTQGQIRSMRRDLVTSHNRTQGQVLRVARHIPVSFTLANDQAISFSAAVVARRLAQGQLGAIVQADIATTFTASQDQHVRLLRGGKRAKFVATTTPHGWTSRQDQGVVFRGAAGNQVTFTSEQG